MSKQRLALKKNSVWFAIEISEEITRKHEINLAVGNCNKINNK